MKLIVVLALVALAAAAPQIPSERTARQSQYDDVQIQRYDSDNSGFGQNRYGSEQSNGQLHDETGELKNADQENSRTQVIYGSLLG